MKPTLIEKIIDRVHKLYLKVKNQDFNDPKVVLTCIACVILPFVAWHYVSTGIVLGILLAIGILMILEKSPKFIKELVCDYPLAADIVLSAIAVLGIAGFFGTGLTLGLGAVFADLILSWALPLFSKRYREEQEQEKEQERIEHVANTITSPGN